MSNKLFKIVTQSAGRFLVQVDGTFVPGVVVGGKGRYSAQVNGKAYAFARTKNEACSALYGLFKSNQYTENKVRDFLVSAGLETNEANELIRVNADGIADLIKQGKTTADIACFIAQ